MSNKLDRYYDSLALRFEWEKREPIDHVFSANSSEFVSGKIKVRSCFGGLAVYDASLFHGCKYEKRKYGNEAWDCEHVHLARCIEATGRSSALCCASRGGTNERAYFTFPSLFTAYARPRSVCLAEHGCDQTSRLLTSLCLRRMRHTCGQHRVCSGRRRCWRRRAGRRRTRTKACCEAFGRITSARAREFTSLQSLGRCQVTSAASASPPWYGGANWTTPPMTGQPLTCGGGRTGRRLILVRSQLVVRI